MRRLVFAVLLLCVSGPRPAIAKPRKPAANAAPAPSPAPPSNAPMPLIDSEPLRAGLAAYEDLDYPRCVALLQKALSESLTRDEKILSHKTLGFCHAALDKPEAAKFDFENLLRLDENFEIDRRVSPRIRAPFEEAKAAIATGQSIEGTAAEVQYKTPTVMPELTPAQPKEGQALTVVAQFDGVADKAQLFYRTRGQAVFSRSLADGKQGHFAVTVPGLYVQPPGLEYYLVLLDEGGSAVARAGAIGQPLWIDVAAVKRPVYTRGWFWGVIGGVAAAGAIVGVVAALSTSSGPSKNASASVTIQPQ